MDGEIVALDSAGQPVGFQALQGRIHLTGGTERSLATKVPVAFIAFDILQDGLQDLTQLPLTARRARLERVFEHSGNERVRLSEVVPNDGTALYQRAHDEGWEGLIAKKADSRYVVGKGTTEWRKIKFARLRNRFYKGFLNRSRSSSTRIKRLTALSVQVWKTMEPCRAFPLIIAKKPFNHMNDSAVMF